MENGFKSQFNNCGFRATMLSGVFCVNLKMDNVKRMPLGL